MCYNVILCLIKYVYCDICMKLIENSFGSIFSCFSMYFFDVLVLQFFFPVSTNSLCRLSNSNKFYLKVVRYIQICEIYINFINNKNNSLYET